MTKKDVNKNIMSQSEDKFNLVKAKTTELITKIK